MKLHRTRGRKSDYQLSIIQSTRLLPIGVYDSDKQQLVVYEGLQYTWPDGTRQTPSEVPLCFPPISITGYRLDYRYIKGKYDFKFQNVGLQSWQAER